MKQISNKKGEAGTKTRNSCGIGKGELQKDGGRDERRVRDGCSCTACLRINCNGNLGRRKKTRKASPSIIETSTGLEGERELKRSNQRISDHCISLCLKVCKDKKGEKSRVLAKGARRAYLKLRRGGERVRSVERRRRNTKHKQIDGRSSGYPS